MIQAPPSHRMTVTNGDKPHEIFMSFGLLNRITRYLGDIDQLPQLAVSPELQEAVLVEIFTERDKQGVALKVPTLDEIEVSLEEVESILDFVGEHIANFFMQTAEKAQKRMLQIHARAEKMSASMPIKPGS